MKTTRTKKPSAKPRTSRASRRAPIEHVEPSAPSAPSVPPVPDRAPVKERRSEPEEVPGEAIDGLRLARCIRYEARASCSPATVTAVAPAMRRTGTGG